MLISVVVPTHNRHVLLKEAIASVESQSYAQWEVIVVDDASDPPVALDARDLADPSRVHLVPNRGARGPSGARNSGIKAASGDVITFLDDDDLLATNALQLIAKAFADADAPECLFVNVEPFGEFGEGTQENQTNATRGILRNLGFDSQASTGRLPLPENLFEVLLDGVSMAFQRVAIRRTALSKVGLYSGSGFDDIEFYFRVALRCRCALLADAVYRPRCAGQSFFSRTDAKGRLLDSSIRVRDGLLKQPEVLASPKLRRVVRRSLADARFERAYFAYQMGGKFRWKDYLASCAMGVAWRHVSLLAKVLARSVSRKSATSTRS